MDIFTLPTRDERINNLSKGMLAWLHVSKKEFRYDPDNYILTQLVRNVVKASFFVGLLVLGLVIYFKNSSNLFYEFRWYLSIIASTIIVIPVYYFQLYKKNVDTIKYNPLIIRETGEKLSSYYLAFVFFPMFLAAMILPNLFEFYIFDIETLKPLYVFYDSYIFVVLSLCVWVIINTGAALMLFNSAVIIYKIYENSNFERYDDSA